MLKYIESWESYWMVLSKIEHNFKRSSDEHSINLCFKNFLRGYKGFEDQRLPGACNRSPGTKVLRKPSFKPFYWTMVPIAQASLPEAAILTGWWSNCTFLKEIHLRTITTYFSCNGIHCFQWEDFSMNFL